MTTTLRYLDDEYGYAVIDRPLAWGMQGIGAEGKTMKRKQLPASMQNCTIEFKECGKGHGWLTATNWVQHECQTCALAALREQRCETCQYASDGDIGLWCEKWSPAIPSSRDVMCADIKGCGAWHGGCRKGE